MKRYIQPPREQWPDLLKRPELDTSRLQATVSAVLQEVRTRGDAAVRHYTLQFDKVDLAASAVSQAEWMQAGDMISPELRAAIGTAYQNIRTFHARQHQEPEWIETMPGVRCFRKSVGIEKVGIYIPGGTAPLFSTVLMLGVPAQLAGCREVVLCSPPGKDGSIHPAILYAAKLAGVTQAFKVGGVQAIGALAYGTESIPKVDKIFGPGNQYVTAAKQMVNQAGIAIDMPAGPSEVMVCADETAHPEFVAADLLSQAEHGADSQVVLVVFDTKTLDQVETALNRQLETLPRKHFAAAALEHSVAIVVADRAAAIELINTYAPEHLILSVAHPGALAEGVVNAGSVFLGHYTPESVGDYASGTNHTLPTNGYARAYSGVSLDSFVKKITFQELTPAGLQTLGPTVEVMAAAEELEAHKLAVSIRLQYLNTQQP